MIAVITNSTARAGELIKFAEKCNPANRQWQQLFHQPFFPGFSSPFRSVGALAS